MVRKLLPAIVNPASDVTGGVKIHSTDQWYRLVPRSAGYLRVDVQAMDAAADELN